MPTPTKGKGKFLNHPDNLRLTLGRQADFSVKRPLVIQVKARQPGSCVDSDPEPWPEDKKLTIRTSPFIDNNFMPTDSSLNPIRKGDKLMEMKEILLVDAKTWISWAYGFILQSNGYLVELAPDVETAWEEITNYHFDLILVYLAESEPEKILFLQRLQNQVPPPKVMAIGSPGNNLLPIEVFQIELEDYLFSPFDAGELCRRVACCLGKNEPLPSVRFFPRKTRRERRVFETIDLRPL